MRDEPGHGTMQRFMIWIAIAVCIACAPSRAADPAGELVRLAVDPWAPFGGETLPGGGLSPDIISTVLERAGYRVESYIVPWARALDGVKTGDYDLLGSLFFDAELETFLSFSVPYHETDIRFIKRVDSPFAFSSIQALEGLTIAVGDGYLYEEAFDNASELDKHVVTTVLQGLRMVAGGRVDLTLDSVDVLDHLLHVEDPSLAARLEYVPGTLARRGVRFAIRDDFPGKDRLLEAFERELLALQADGALETLRTRHASVR